VFLTFCFSLDVFREFGRWKVNNLAVERREFLESQLPLTPEFIRNIRFLGRRPTTQTITENLIRKYGTHFLLSATLGGKRIIKRCSFLVYEGITLLRFFLYPYLNPLTMTFKILWPIPISSCPHTDVFFSKKLNPMLFMKSNFFVLVCCEWGLLLSISLKHLWSLNDSSEIHGSKSNPRYLAHVI